jgi:hypothetical protein
MKDKDQQNNINTKLLHILDNLHKNMDKEEYSTKEEDHRSHTRKEESRSAGRYHHHSLRHSVARAGRSSSLSPVRKHNRRTGVDELKGEMRNIKPPTFDGEHKNDEYVEACFLGMRNYFQLDNYSSHAEAKIATYQLKGKSSMWWDQLMQVKHIDEKNITWRQIIKYV